MKSSFLLYLIRKARSYSQCITSDNRKPWCATAVDEDGYMSKWGFCNNNCVVGIFPFNSNIGIKAIKFFYF